MQTLAIYVRSRLLAAIQAGAVSQSKLARYVGVSVQNLNAYLKGKYKTIAVLPELAKRLGVPIEWLTTGKGPAPAWASDTPEPRPIVIQGGGPEQIPLIGTAAASDGRSFGLAFEHPESYQWRAGRVLVRVAGDSAFPVAFAGQFVVCEPERPVRQNKRRSN